MNPAVEAGEFGTPSLAQSATVTVDSTFPDPDYGPRVLTDGRWYAKGEEDPEAYGPARLGNAGNTWVSSEAPGEHWICLEWAQPITLDEVEIWWAVADWYPRAFRIERWQDAQWVSAGPGEGWLVPRDRQSVIPLPRSRTQRLRIVQSSLGATTRQALSAQEVLVFDREEKPRALAGARALSPGIFARLTAGLKLERNLARLNELCPGAASVAVWDAKGREKAVGDSGDFGDNRNTRAALSPGCALGVKWEVPHSMDGVSVAFANEPPGVSSLVLQAHDGQGWVAVTTGLESHVRTGQRRIEWTFEPVVTRAVRVHLARGETRAPVAEIAALRFTPPGKDVWPDRFVQKGVLQQELLGAKGEPSFEAVALKAHNMRTARAFVGLKDDPSETGIGWEGSLYGRDRRAGWECSLYGREKIQFRFGAEGYTLGEYPDTVSRTLIDGWRPGVLVEGRMRDLHVRETVFAVPIGAESRPIVFIRLSIRNLSPHPRNDWVEAEILGERPGEVQLTNGVLKRGADAILLSPLPAAGSESSGALRIAFTLRPGEERHVDFIHPQDTNAPASLLEQCRAVSFEKALAEFRRYWDRLMATPTGVEVPEARVNRAIKAVLAQCFVSADGDIMYYGATPSVYEGCLFGIEESYPMLGLGLFGHGKDAQRYLEGTYLTREFLKKTETYNPNEPEFRHQQYRNGLAPHYAASLYWLTRDADWIRRQVPLLKECAEWTVAQRRRTMELEGGQRPLHWGLLPKWAYGGDIMDVLCYPLFPNVCCWRGLLDTASVLEKLGDEATAARYRAEARAYWADIDRAMDAAYRQDQPSPYLALRLYGTQPDEYPEYYQAFASCLLDVGAFEPGSRHARRISDYLEDSNRMFCHLPRSRHVVGAGALCALYGKGYWLSLLHEDAIGDVLLAFYALLALNMEHETFVSRETNVLYPSDLQQRSGFPNADKTDPLVCGSAAYLHLVRHMLVTEERGAAGDCSGSLLLLAGVPRAWLQNGKAIRLREMPTHFGPTSLEVLSHATRERVEARFTPPTRTPCKTAKLRLRHPEGSLMRSVWVNGKPWSDFDATNEWILLPGNIGPCRVVAQY